MRCIPTVLLTLLLLSSAVAFIPDTSSAEDQTVYHDGKFSFILNSSNKAILTMYDNEHPEQIVEIPSPIIDRNTGTGYELVEIRGEFDSPTIEKIVIPTTVTTISEMAFYAAKGVKEYDIDGVSSYFEVDGGVLYTYGMHKLVRYPVNNDATTYTINSTTSEICMDAFAGATKLETVNFGTNLVKISDQAFNDCTSLTTVNFNSTLSVIGSSAFYSCTSLTTVVFPDDLVMIGNHAFYESGLTGTVNIPYGVEYIGDGAFASCTKLTGFTSDNYRYTVGEGDDTGILFYGGEDNKSLMCYPAGRPNTEYTLQPKITVNKNAFEGCVNLKTIHLPSDYTTIPQMTFYGCHSLESIDLENVSVIEPLAFFNCYNLTSVNLSDNLLVIGELSFMMSGLEKIEIPSSVVTVDSMAFCGCDSLTDVTIAESSKATFDVDVFLACNHLKTITVNSSDVVFEKYSLTVGNDLQDVTIDVYVKSGYSLPSDVADEHTIINVKIIGERPYPWVNIIGVVICALGIIGILYGMRQV